MCFKRTFKQWAVVGGRSRPCLTLCLYDCSLDQNTILTLSLEVFWKNDEQLNRVIITSFVFQTHNGIL